MKAGNPRHRTGEGGGQISRLTSIATYGQEIEKGVKEQRGGDSRQGTQMAPEFAERGEHKRGRGGGGGWSGAVASTCLELKEYTVEPWPEELVHKPGKEAAMPERSSSLRVELDRQHAAQRENENKGRPIRWKALNKLITCQRRHKRQAPRAREQRNTANSRKGSGGHADQANTRGDDRTSRGKGRCAKPEHNPSQ